MNALTTIATADTAILASLAEHAEAARGAYATNTERALKADTALWTAWCAAADLTSLPASPAALARFIDAMSLTRAPASVRRYVSSISTLHRAAGLTSPAEAEVVKLALKRMHRERGRAQRQASPLNRNLVERLLTAGGSTARDLRNRALLAVAYDTLARQSELAALNLADLAISADGSAAVTIRRSKTDQEGAGMVRYIAPDTMAHLQAWRDAAGLTDGPLFRAVFKGGRIAGGLAGPDVARIFKAMALAAGVTEAGRISGHSSRVGAAQDMVAAGVELPAIMTAGGWRTAEMVARYTARLDVKRSGSAKLAVIQNRA